MVHMRVYADFQRTDDEGRLLLTTVGSSHDLESLGDALVDGLAVTFYMDDWSFELRASDELEVDGKLHFDHSLQHWVGTYDQDGFRHASDRLRAERGGPELDT
jgi:hypothetical protein